MVRAAVDPRRLPGEDIDWDEYVMRGEPADYDNESDLPDAYYLWSTDAKYDMFELTPLELNTL